MRHFIRTSATTRPVRLEFPDALHYVTSRGCRREDIFQSDDDRYDWLNVLGATCQWFNCVLRAFCQTSNWKANVYILTINVEISNPTFLSCPK